MHVEIFMPEVTRLTTKTKLDEGVLITTVQFEARIPVGNLARILNLQRQGAPLMASIASPQARLDLQFSELKIEPKGKESAKKLQEMGL